MCQTVHQPIDPAEALSDLIQKELRIRITPAELRMFLGYNWQRVTAYAHLIHQGN